MDKNKDLIAPNMRNNIKTDENDAFDAPKEKHEGGQPICFKQFNRWK